MTRLTANAILLLMAGVWGYLSIVHGELQPISENFLYVGVLLAGGEIVEYYTQKLKGTSE